MSTNIKETKKGWPEDYGFWIWGRGPTFVVRVEPLSTSDKAGICVGDWIVELDNQDTRNHSADTVKRIANNSKKQPPKITVRGCSQRLILNSVTNSTNKSFLDLYGFTICKGDLAQIDRINPASQAYKSGLRTGDIIIKVNDILINNAEQCQTILVNTKHDTIDIRFISLNKTVNTTSTKYRDRSLPASLTALNNIEVPAVIDSILMTQFIDDQNKKNILTDELKAYQKTRNLQRLSHKLNTLLVLPEERRLINLIKNKVVYNEQREAFEVMMKKSNKNSTENLDKLTSHVYNQHVSSTPVQAESLHFNKPPKKIIPIGKRRLSMVKYAYEPLGITLKKGTKPPQVSSVISESVAQYSGLLEDDVILSVNNINVENKSPEEITKLLQYQNIDMEVIQGPEYQKNLANSTNNNSFSTESSHYFETLSSIDGSKFKQAVGKVLSKTEKSSLKRILIDYSNSKNTDKMIEKINRLLNTPAKRELWPYLEQIVDDQDRQFLNKFTPDLNKPIVKASNKTSPSFKLRNKLNRKNIYGSHNLLDTSDVISLRDLRESKQSLSTPSLNSFHVKKSEGPVANLSKQVSYLLNQRDRNEIIKCLEDYDVDRDIYTLVKDISALLDTSAKRTLWFHLIPLLDEDDQEFCKRKLSLKDFDFVQEKSDFSIDKLNDYQNIDEEVYILTDTEIDTLFVLNKRPFKMDANSARKVSVRKHKSRGRNEDMNKRFSYPSQPSNHYYLTDSSLKNTWLEKSDYEFENDSSRIRQMHDYIRMRPEPEVYSYLGDYRSGN